MEALDVFGGARLVGTVRAPGAKNSVLKLMAASLLAEGRTRISNVPKILDVEIMAELLRRLGCEVTHDLEAATLEIVVPAEPAHQADYDLVRRMRASINVLGPLIARVGLADVALPGGDAIGSRGLDMHIDGLTLMGVEVTNEHGYLVARVVDELVGASIVLDLPSVGATENLVTAAVLAHGTTIIDNAAREPEIVDLCEFLVSMGAKIQGAGTSTMTIEGVDRLRPTAHSVVPDRIVTGTWVAAAVITQGDITITGCRPEHLDLPLTKARQAGARITLDDDSIRVQQTAQPRAIDIVTLPYPGFPTDLQPAFIALNAIANGTALVTENLFEARFRFVQELARLGADVKIDGHHALVRGRDTLSGAPVEATDIRAGASLVLAGLVADGVTTVIDIQHIDRGFEGFDEQLRSLGADVRRRTIDG
jgi:UDP-N-acetylglucosamine 1-carboxyvinyltransferase